MDSLEARLATRLHGLRTARGLTLDALAEQSGVSRSMISLIERAESSPTANVLDRLAASLGVTLAALFGEATRTDAAPLAHRAAQTTWRDPETGYLRRNLSPAGFASPIELVEIVLPPETRVAYDNTARNAALEQQVWVIDGAIEVMLGEASYRLGAGDCLAMRVDRPTAFHNRGPGEARYLVAIGTADTRTGGKRRSGR